MDSNQYVQKYTQIKVRVIKLRISTFSIFSSVYIIVYYVTLSVRFFESPTKSMCECDHKMDGKVPEQISNENIQNEEAAVQNILKNPNPYIQDQLKKLRLDDYCFCFEQSTRPIEDDECAKSEHESIEQIENSQDLSQLTFKEQEMGTTSLRKDVMNKTIFRSIRREYKEMFSQFCKKNKIKIGKSIKRFHSAVSDFTESLIENSDFGLENSKFGNFRNLVSYAGLFSNF